MIYTELTCMAARIAFEAHAGQYDKCGMPYIMHPLHLAEEMTDEKTTVTALLHDVVEDTSVTLDDLRAEGIPEDIIAALDLLTHREGVPYSDYVSAIKDNPIARAVKLADLRHNMDQSRFSGALSPIPSEKLARRLEKYRRAMEILGEE